MSIIDNKDLYKKKMESQLDEWHATMKLINAKLKNAKTSAEISVSETADELKEKREIAEEKLSLLKKSGNESWEKAKNDVENAYTELRKSMDDILKKLEG